MENTSPTGWSELREWIKTVALLLVPIAGVWIGNSYNEAIKERETQIRYVELAIQILHESPRPGTENIRDWAINIASIYSPVPFKAATQHELSKTPLILPAPTNIRISPK